MLYIILAIIILLVFLFYTYITKEGFYNLVSFPNCIEDVFGKINCFNPIINPFWYNTRYTRNMSYDIRGDPIFYPYREIMWMKKDGKYHFPQLHQ